MGCGMKNTIKFCIFIFLLMIVLSACSNQVDYEISGVSETEAYIFATAAENTEVEPIEPIKLIEVDFAEEIKEFDEDAIDEIEEIEEINENSNIINFVFSKTISDTLPPFYFTVVGEVIRHQYIAIDSLIVTDNEHNFIQELRINTWLSSLDATEDNYFGFVFEDYKSNGFLGIHHLNHYWYWDYNAKLFIHDWKLAGDVTEDNIIDYTIVQSINENMHPFTIRLLGVWVAGWNNHRDYNYQPNIRVIQVINYEGRLIQEFSRLNAHPPYWAESFGLHFRDYNFDGFLDMALYMSEGGRAGNSPHSYWLWDNQLGRFVFNEHLSEISQFTRIGLNEEQQVVFSSARFGFGHHAFARLKYVDGDFEIVSIRHTEPFSIDDRYIGTRFTEVDFIADTEIVTYEMFYYRQINENLPSFSFTRSVGWFVEENYNSPFPNPRDVSIEITKLVNIDDTWRTIIIQYIPNLFQSDSHIYYGLVFEDLNFDGYLDMRLKRWQDGAGGLLVSEYIWLWDTTSEQFVLNEQLMEIEYKELSVCEETERIVIFNRGGSTYYYMLSFYEYHNGEFVLVSYTRETIHFP